MQIPSNIAIDNAADNNLEKPQSNNPHTVENNSLQATGKNVQVPRNNELQTPQRNELENIAHVQFTADENVKDLESNDHQNNGKYSLKNAGQGNFQKPRTNTLQNHTNNLHTISSHRLQVLVRNNSQNPRNASLQISGRNHPSIIISKLNISLFNIRHINPEILDTIRMIHSPDPCGDDIYLVIFVHSAIENSARRTLIRSTWAKPQAKVKIIFILATGSQNNMEFVAQEADEFTDICTIWVFRFLQESDLETLDGLKVGQRFLYTCTCQVSSENR